MYILKKSFVLVYFLHREEIIAGGFDYRRFVLCPVFVLVFLKYGIISSLFFKKII